MLCVGKKAWCLSTLGPGTPSSRSCEISKRSFREKPSPPCSLLTNIWITAEAQAISVKYMDVKSSHLPYADKFWRVETKPQSDCIVPARRESIQRITGCALVPS